MPMDILNRRHVENIQLGLSQALETKVYKTVNTTAVNPNQINTDNKCKPLNCGYLTSCILFDSTDRLSVAAPPFNVT